MFCSSAEFPSRSLRLTNEEVIQVLSSVIFLYFVGIRITQLYIVES